MGKEKFKFIRSAAIAVIITACLTISIQSILAAWTAPTIAPPDGNVDAPVNIGLLTQIKSGIFGITNDFYVGANTFFVDESGTGNVGIGTTNPSAKLSIQGNSGQSTLYIASSTSNHLLSVDSGGRLRIGDFNSSWANNFFDTGSGPNALNISGNNKDIALISAGPGGNKADIGIFRALGTISSPVNVDNSTNLGQINFHAYYNGSFNPGGANEGRIVSVQAKMDGGVVSASSLPTALSFYTTPEGGVTYQERMVIKNNGNVGIGTTNPNAKLDVNGLIKMWSVSSAGSGTCDSDSELGSIFFDKDGTYGDVKVCRKDGAGGYEWKKLSWD